MNMARKRKSCSPEPLTRLSKALKGNETECELQVANSVLHTLTNRRGSVNSPTKRNCSGITLPDGLPSVRQSPRFKQQPVSSARGPSGDESQQSPSPSQTQSDTEDDTEVGLVITFDGDGCDQTEGTKAKRGSESSEEDDPPCPGLGPHTSSSPERESDDEFGQLDLDLERKSKEHNLTSLNIRTILHEVITNEHVVAMMKAAIKETQGMPMFEPKMTRSRLKQVVEEGVIPNWNISPIKRANEPPQFVDIPLEEEEDSSDEEYCPEEDEEDETAEETFLSDVDSTTSSPRCARGQLPRTPVPHAESEEDTTASPTQKPKCSRHLRVAAVPMGPPPPPPPTAGAPDPSFMEKLHAVDEELAFSLVSPEAYQALGGVAGSGVAGGLVACRTRSKRPLRDVPLGQLEAELRAPDTTPDMYDCAAALEDRHWSEWLRGLMASDVENEEDGDDDDDPEYNFLEDLDEPDREDYRTDRAVRITKKEVNELLEELFETFQDELGGAEEVKEGREEDEDREEEAPSQSMPKFNVPQAIRFQAPLASMLTERRRAVREQYEAQQQRRALQDTPTFPRQLRSPALSSAPLVLLRPALTLDSAQKLQLQQQVQQHIQLLTQVHLLCGPVEALHNEAYISRQYLDELQLFATRQEDKWGSSIFKACNLQGALSLIEEQKTSPPGKPALGHTSCSPRTPSNSLSKGRSYPQLPARTAWLLATRPVFLYPELLPLCSLDPALHRPRTKPGKITRGEESLIVLGLEHFRETQTPYSLMCQYLIRRYNHEQLRNHVKEMCGHVAPNNIVKRYHEEGLVPAMPLACVRVRPGEERPPVEREESILPNWLKKSLPAIHRAVMSRDPDLDEGPPPPERPQPFPRGTRYTPSLPANVRLRLHPHMPDRDRRRAPVAPKPRPFHGFAPTASLAPLAKAPADTAGYLAHVPGPVPSHGVILLAVAPSTPPQGALPLGQVPVTPAHGAVASGLMRIGPAIPTGSHLFGQGVVTACGTPSPSNQTEATSLPAQRRKLPAIHPAPLKQGHSAPFATAAGQTSAWLPRRTRRPPPSDVGAKARAKARAAATARQRTLARPLLPAPPTLDTGLGYGPALPDGGGPLRSSPVFFTSLAPPPVSVNPQLANQGCHRNRATPIAGVGFDPSTAFSRPPGRQQLLHAPSLVPDPTTQELWTSERSRTSDYVLVRMTSHGSTQMVWVPESCLAPDDAASGLPQHAVPQPDSPCGLSDATEEQQALGVTCDLPGGMLGQSLEEQLYQLVEGLKEGGKVERLQEGGKVEVEGEGGQEEEEEEEEREGWEDLDGPLLTLSASSGSPCCSVDGQADALERMMGREEEGEEAGSEGWRAEVGPGGQRREDTDGDAARGRGAAQDATRLSGETAEQSGDEGGEEADGGEGGSGGGGEEERSEGREEGDGEQGHGEQGGEGEDDGGGEGGQGGGEKDGDGDPERPGDEEEEEEDFDDLTQDEDEEEVMSSASEESVLSVPELQETMKKLTWLASEGRLCGEADSEEDNSPNSPVSQNSQEENSDEEEEGPGAKGEEPGEGGVTKAAGDDDAPQEEGAPRAGGRGGGRGRGRRRPPPRSLRRSRRQERDSKDASKLLLLYDDHILDNDPLRESKDHAFAQAYLNRVRETLQDVPGKVEEFLTVLYEFEQGPEGRSVVELFSQLRAILADWPELLRDFAAFLLPEQALECGLFEEQQAFERSRRFLRQLEISFGENPSHYQKIVKALQCGPGLSAASIEELKALMSSLLKGHTHLQGEFGVFFDELRPPPARPGQFEEACWPEEGGAGAEGGGEGGGLAAGGGASSGFEEVTLPDLEEEEEGHKIPVISGRSSRRRRKLGSLGNYKECDWPEKDCPCLCHDAKLRRHRRKGCSRCHSNKAPHGVSRAMKSLDPMYPSATSPTAPLSAEGGGARREEEEEEEEKEEEGVGEGAREEEPEEEKEEEEKEEVDSGMSSPQAAHHSTHPWKGPEEGALPLTDEREEEETEEEEEEEEWKDGEGERSPSAKKSRADEGEGPRVSNTPPAPSTPLPLGMDSPPSALQPRPSPPSDPPVCAKNISLTASGERVILWTREADRVILTTCQLQGANQGTFQAISTQLGNKTPNEVSRRFRDLMHLFHTAARQVNPKDDSGATGEQTATEKGQD